MVHSNLKQSRLGRRGNCFASTKDDMNGFSFRIFHATTLKFHLKIICKDTDIVGVAYFCPEDGVYPNYYDCTTFITCSNGLQYVMSCPEGLIWNVDTNECDWPNNTECVSYPRKINYGQ